jgi:hypothetical protein
MPAKVFLLDSARAADPLPGFLLHAAARAGWETARPQFFEDGMDGDRWLGEFRRELGDANIIIGLGNFVALLQWGEHIGEVLTLIDKKIEAGCPILLSGCSSLVSSTPDQPFTIRAILDAYGIRLTPIRVATRVQQVEKNSSTFCCAFDSDDDSLLDPNLFEGVPRIIAYGNRLISYDPGVFPIIEASRTLHYFADRGDLIHRGNLGQRNAVAVIRRSAGRCIIAMTGDVLGDRAEVIAGTRPGWEDNGRFADNLIDFLGAYLRNRTEHTPARLYEAFSELETLLGKLIEAILSSNSPTREFSNLIPGSVRKKLYGPTGAFDYGRATYIDLIVILRDQFSKFEKSFDQPAGEVLKLLFDINRGQRSHLAHPHKATQLGVTFGPDDAEVLRRALELVRRASAAAAAM